MEHTKDDRVDITVDQIDNIYICGYKARDLMTLALMLEGEGVSQSDLDEYVRNVEHIYIKLETDFNERISKIIGGYFEGRM